MAKKTNNKITKADYYKELHSASRSYNTKLWTIPGLFILVVGFIFKGLEFNSMDSFASLKNFILLVGGGVIIFMLLLQSLKDSFFQISIQKKINELEESEKAIEGMPLYSATDTEITRRLQQLKENFDTDGHRTKFWRPKEYLIRMRVSKPFFLIVGLSLFLIAIGLALMVLEKLKNLNLFL